MMRLLWSSRRRDAPGRPHHAEVQQHSCVEASGSSCCSSVVPGAPATLIDVASDAGSEHSRDHSRRTESRNSFLSTAGRGISRARSALHLKTSSRGRTHRGSHIVDVENAAPLPPMREHPDDAAACAPPVLGGGFGAGGLSGASATGAGGALCDVTNTAGYLGGGFAAAAGVGNFYAASEGNAATFPAKQPLLRRVPQGGKLQLPHQQELLTYEPCSGVFVDGGESAGAPVAATASSASSTAVVVQAKTSEELAAEYAVDIHRTLLAGQVASRARPDYMMRQPHINAKMRAILVDWLVDLHRSHKQRRETLFLAVSLADRYLERRQVQRNRLQLVGVTALWIASKFEELCPLELPALVAAADNAYSREIILASESQMLNVLEFKVCVPTGSHFLERLVASGLDAGAAAAGDASYATKAGGGAVAQVELARYLLELALVDYDMLEYSPSQLALAALLLSSSLCRRRAPLQAAREAAGEEAIVLACMSRVHALLDKANGSVLQAVKRKYSSSEHASVACRSYPRAGPAMVSV
eukprot:TRINITY_DN24770_c0_g2_i1.p2 TRINITY_DN24770_c0_g2~~TRINITY_DN24770_c0_g2_i1.p2  ORF type:complete len:530 (+),score=114.29 TRINITY_DN24770_c0_g2_i1:251-1840(+)